MSENGRRKDGLIFDLDGTLVDTLPDIATALNLTRERLGLALLAPAEITRWVGNGTEFLVRKTVEVPPEQREEAHALYLEFYDAHMLDASCLNRGVAEILERYQERSLAVITNKPGAATEKLLAGLGVRSFFKQVLGGDALPRKKPDPLPLVHFMEAEGLRAEQVVIVGDGVNDIRAGLAAGVTTVGVTFGVSTGQELAAEGAHHIIDQMADLAGLIE